ncbi:MAG: hypothetical protein K2Q21_03030 [Chitinophagaceae bacterium]|nr:hypothetical protein [Chitinophagaceae bacterium]
MNYKLVIVLLLLVAATSLVYINVTKDWILIAIGLIAASSALITAGFLLLIRNKRQQVVEVEK